VYPNRGTRPTPSSSVKSSPGTKIVTPVNGEFTEDFESQFPSLAASSSVTPIDTSVVKETLTHDYANFPPDIVAHAHGSHNAMQPYIRSDGPFLSQSHSSMNYGILPMPLSTAAASSYPQSTSPYFTSSSFSHPSSSILYAASTSPPLPDHHPYLSSYQDTSLAASASMMERQKDI
jgi:hypothetical protein